MYGNRHITIHVLNAACASGLLQYGFRNRFVKLIVVNDC
jgi:hypothetical protein